MGNTVAHVGEFEAQPGRRPFTYGEVQALFDAADARVEEIRARGRKGVLTGMRDAALLKTVYAFGLRRREACGLDLADFRRNPKVAQFGRFGGLFVRTARRRGAGRRGGARCWPSRRWAGSSEVLRHWVDEVRPCLAPGSHPAVWVTERRGRIAVRTADTAFAVRGRRPGCPRNWICIACGIRISPTWSSSTTRSGSSPSRPATGMRRRPPFTRASQMTTATGCCAGRWNATPGCGRKRHDQEDGLSGGTCAR